MPISPFDSKLMSLDSSASVRYCKVSFIVVHPKAHVLDKTDVETSQKSPHFGNFLSVWGRGEWVKLPKVQLLRRNEQIENSGGIQFF